MDRMDTEKIERRGGARPGAGRPKKAKSERKKPNRLSVTLLKTEWTELEQLSDGRTYALAKKIIEQYLFHHGHFDLDPDI